MSLIYTIKRSYRGEMIGKYIEQPFPLNLKSEI